MRAATGDDLPAVVALTRAQRSRLARWAPVYFNPAAHADDLHAGYLGWLVSSADHDTRVVVDDGEVCAFAHVIEQGTHHWADDLCWVDGRGTAGLELLASVEADAVATCVAAEDDESRSLLADHGFAVTSAYWSRPLDRDGASPPAVGAAPRHPLPAPPLHTFGPIGPGDDGALTIAEGDSLVVGSPSVSPPIYDPGGPSCVIDRVLGPDRSGLVRAAMAEAAGRGDAQMIVVVDADDDELTDAVMAVGFVAQVQLLIRGASTAPSGGSDPGRTPRAGG